MRPAQLAGLISAGIPLNKALEDDDLGERGLVKLAISVGAPLTQALLVMEQQLLASERISAEISQAQAVPRATRKLLLWLPLLSVVMGEVMGLGTISGLFTQIGFIALSLALLILWVGAKVSNRMLSGMAKPDLGRSEELLALDLCLSAGVRMGEIESLLEKPLTEKPKQLLADAIQSGASIRPLIASEVAIENQNELNLRLSDAKRLSVSLLIPLSLSTLPAFLLLTIPPMLIGITQ